MVSLDWGMFWQVLNFLILMFILVKYLYNPITNVLEKRSNKIENSLSEADKKRKEAEELKEKYEAELANARKEAQEIRNQAKQKAEEEKAEIIREANEEANRKLEKAEEEIARTKREAMAEIRDEVATMSVLIAQKLVEKSIDQQVQQQIVSDYIDELDSEKIGEIQC
ncbi:F0F1 ATP synthase subunit B [Sporohalobacter salinus]|uniref:F0F1 ATP synthase subunit B n=1 Tax=Sporohalobacter salinus TaxID=1494606 RepID=UPI00195FB3AB|nr:F0F1 ATP synthase subunit B [Sporohalobacter salinus]MBM7622896.1 F-type H+-transporting ATPase subunit b [Sporohalobacter salinus]